MFNQGCRFEAGWEALLFLACLSNGALEEPEAGYGSLVEGVEASQLLALIRQAREKLEVNLQDAGAPPLVVSKDYRIYLGSRRGREIRMRPMTKAVFLLFLNHPEGICFRQLNQYREELQAYYGRLSRLDSKEDIARCVDRVLEEGSRELSVAASRVGESLGGLIDREFLPAYLISGARGGVKRIALDRKLVVWL